MDKSRPGCSPQDPANGKKLYDNVLRAHVARDGRHFALYRSQDESFLVTIDGTDFGPFSDSDAAALSPFRLSGRTWAFRARGPDGIVLVVDGTVYGPFEEVWQPAVSAPRWGALVRKQGQYHVLVDGELSGAYDEIAGDHRLETAFPLRSEFNVDIPLFFGAGRWAAFGRRGEDQFIITGAEVAGPFRAISRLQFAQDPAQLDAAELWRNLSFDRSALAVGIAKKVEGDAPAYFLWVNGTEHGPCHELPAFHGAADMSVDGKRWAFHDPQAVYTHEGTFERPSCLAVAISDNGAAIVEVYGTDGDNHLLVNGTEQGPFHTAGLFPSISPDGTRWVDLVQPLGDANVAILTESGRLGPFKSATPHFLGNQWVSGIMGVDDKISLLIDGQSFGPYRETLVPASPADRTGERDWIGLGFRADGPVDVFLTGQLARTTAPFDLAGVPYSRGCRWSVLGKLGEQLAIIENGTFSAPLGPFKRVIGQARPENQSRLALTAMDANDQFLVVFRDASFGPFPIRPSAVIFSSDGNHWSFQVSDGAGKSRAIGSQGESPLYDEITDWTVTERGALFAGKQGSDWWLHIGTERHGPFAAAGLAVSGGTVTAVIVCDGRAEVKTF